MTDKEVIEKWVETCLNYIDPFLLREVEKRGLYPIINKLPSNKIEARAVAYVRLQEAGKVFGDAEIDYIAGNVKELERLRDQLNQVSMTDAHRVSALLSEMQSTALNVLNYFK